MNIPKQFVNLIGAVLAVAIAAAGMLLVAVPVWTESRSITNDAELVAETNLGYEVQIASLRKSEAGIDDIQDTVEELRREIPAEPRLDEVFEIIAAAAADTGVALVSATAGDRVAWAPRAALTAAATPGEVSTEGTEVTAPDPSTDASDPSTDASAPSTDTPGTETAVPGTTTEGEGAAAVGPQTQVDFTMTLTAPTTEAAQRFIDALGDGPRLISIGHSALSSGATGYDLTVNALAFVRTEN